MSNHYCSSRFQPDELPAKLFLHCILMNRGVVLVKREPLRKSEAVAGRGAGRTCAMWWMEPRRASLGAATPAPCTAPWNAAMRSGSEEGSQLGLVSKWRSLLLVVIVSVAWDITSLHSRGFGEALSEMVFKNESAYPLLFQPIPLAFLYKEKRK